MRTCFHTGIRKPIADWIEVREISDVNKTIFSKLFDIGEASAIALVMQTENALLIVDHKCARQFAMVRNK